MLESKLTESFGRRAYRKIALKCKNGLLTEVQIALPAAINEAESIEQLIARTTLKKFGNCQSRIKIDAY